MRLLPMVLAMSVGYSGLATAHDMFTWTAAFRYRLETVDQTGFTDDATAHTARLRLGARAALSDHVSAVLEGEGVWAINNHFNSGANGRTQFPAVVDPSALEVNQAFVEWKSTEVEGRLGRQRINIDSQRFIGAVGWRQNEQTFDAALITVKPSESLDLQLGWIDRAHRFPSDRARDPLARERDLNAPLLHAAWRSSFGQLVGYAYRIEDEDVIRASTQTSGARWVGTGKLGDWQWTQTLEAAHQQDAGNNPLAFSHSYGLIESAATRSAWTAKLGFERLGGNGTHAFQTPLATLHAFNGWADVFTVTPNNGLEDIYVSAAYAWSGASKNPINLALVWHDFSATRSGADYGQEWDASISTALTHGWSILGKFADYNSEDFGRDAQKLWLQVEWAH